MTTLTSPAVPSAHHFRDGDAAGGTKDATDRRLLILGGLAGVATGFAYFAAQAIPWDHDLPVETARWEAVLGFWTILAVAPFAIVFAYALYRLISW